MSHDTFRTLSHLEFRGKQYHYYSLSKLEAQFQDVKRLPLSLKILLENLLRQENGTTVTKDDIQKLATWTKKCKQGEEIAYLPARVLMQDFTGVPAVVDLAAMREAMTRLGGNARQINPLSRVDLVIDHSVMVDKYASKNAFEENKKLEYDRNTERYRFLKWGQKAFKNFGLVPPGTGICHQVNLEHLAEVVRREERDQKTFIFPDTLVGTDSHTTMVNGLSVLGWGVGGIEAEAAMLGKPISMLVPEVIGFCLKGRLHEGVTATDLVLTITHMLRKKGVVGKFVEFYGPGLKDLPLADRATIANMAPEYGATCGFFPIDEETLSYLAMTGREEYLDLIKDYAHVQGLWRNDEITPLFSDTLSLDLSDVEPCLAGPKRPQDQIYLSDVPHNFVESLKSEGKSVTPYNASKRNLEDGDVVIAAITSCTNTSNPSVLVAAGLLAQKAVQYGLRSKEWVKTSFAPGSQVVRDYLIKGGLQDSLDALGFHIIGYGCTTCIGNSGPLLPHLEKETQEKNLTVASVLSGNRNFEGRVHPLVKANYLASPPLVVAYALLGSVKADIAKTPLGHDQKGNPIYLKDIWPTSREISEIIRKAVTSDLFKKRYAAVFEGDADWQALQGSSHEIYDWDEKSTYIKRPPFFETMEKKPLPLVDIHDAHPLLILGDSVTTDHISPAGSIGETTPAGLYLKAHGIEKKDFNSYGARRGNHEVMMRGTFANIRLRNEMVAGGKTGGFTVHKPSNQEMSVFDAAMHYQQEKKPLVVIAGKEYGTGSSRDWAAKGTKLLGVKAVIAESFERIHRSNLIGMGVLPLEFKPGITRLTLSLDGSELFSIRGLETLTPKKDMFLEIKRSNGASEKIPVLCRIDTEDELQYYKNDGILPYVMRGLLSK